jgi:hypothetical protein
MSLGRAGQGQSGEGHAGREGGGQKRAAHGESPNLEKRRVLKSVAAGSIATDSKNQLHLA